MHHTSISLIKQQLTFIMFYLIRKKVGGGLCAE